jgi:hypothetical protein
MRVKMKRSVSKSHFLCFITANQNSISILLVIQYYVNFCWLVLKTRSVLNNLSHTRECYSHTLEYRNYTRVCRNCTCACQMTFLRVEIKRCVGNRIKVWLNHTLAFVSVSANIFEAIYTYTSEFHTQTCHFHTFRVDLKHS